MALSIYDEILNNKEDEQAKISLRAIEYITKLYTNFAKYEYVRGSLTNVFIEFNRLIIYFNLISVNRHLKMTLVMYFDQSKAT